MFEKHDQLIMEVSTQYLINAMTNFEKKHPEALKSVTDGASAEAFVLYFLEESEISFYFKKTEVEEDKKAGSHGVEEDKKGDEPRIEVKKADDLITYARDMVSRLIISLIFDRFEKEEDPVGLRGIRRIMIPYFLNRKNKVQDSKVIITLHNTMNRIQSKEHKNII